MAQLQYGTIPELERKLQQAQAAEQKQTPQLVRNSVTDAEIAEIQRQVERESGDTWTRRR